MNGVKIKDIGYYPEGSVVLQFGEYRTNFISLQDKEFISHCLYMFKRHLDFISELLTVSVPEISVSEVQHSMKGMVELLNEAINEANVPSHIISVVVEHYETLLIGYMIHCDTKFQKEHYYDISELLE
ncbi:hypothetical protein [Vibrio sp. 10N.239.312.D08]|uniref:hypothetical protein n=1 Tax=Vibrio sp. 10N.239.312.D08 TaxID=3229978 RepID=UPI00354FB541